MTRDDILRMASEAGLISTAYDSGFMERFTLKLERFAALVAAAERDRVCKIVYGLCISDNNAFEIVQAIKKERHDR